MGPEDARRFFVVHLQKTAGTTLRDRLRSHFPEPAIYPNRTDGRDKGQLVISVEHLRARWAERGHEIRLLTGHFPLSVTELLGGDFVTMSIVREPVERTLSYLRHQKQLNPADHPKRLDEIYDDPFRFHGLIRNHMTRMFALASDELADGDGVLTPMEDTAERLERAKGALASLDALGLHHDLDPFFEQLQDRFGLDVGDPLRSNTTAPEVAPRGLVDRILEDNQLDVALWEHAKHLVATRPRP